jgi:hypothetical protein
VEKYGTARQATEGDMAHALCMLDIKGYKLILRICNIYCSFFTAQMVKQTCLNITLHLHCVSCNSWLHFVRQFVLRILVDLSEVSSVVE